jgi:L-ascorbate metabolism protein UlaG (beta-lactamase superfamily)
MRLQLIRNATLRLTYAERLVLIDPYLAVKYSWEPLVGKSRNPLVDLSCPPHEVIADVELVIISHLHHDHFDLVAQELLPRETFDFDTVSRAALRASAEAAGIHREQLLIPADGERLTF